MKLSMKHLMKHLRFKDEGSRHEKKWRRAQSPHHHVNLLIFISPTMCGIRMILFKVSAWATGLRNLDFIGIIMRENTHNTHTQISVFSSLALTNDLLDQPTVFTPEFLKCACRGVSQEMTQQNFVASSLNGQTQSLFLHLLTCSFTQSEHNPSLTLARPSEMRWTD